MTKPKQKKGTPPGKDQKKKPPKTVGYLRVSTIDQDLDKNKADILKLANDRNFGKVKFIEEKTSGYKTGWKDRKVKKIIDDLEKGDRLIVPEMSRLSTAKENDGKIEKNRREQRGRNDGAPSRSLTSSQWGLLPKTP